jgi:hypothetical protein
MKPWAMHPASPVRSGQALRGRYRRQRTMRKAAATKGEVLSPRCGLVQEAPGAIGERVGELRKGEKIEGEAAVSIGHGS